MGDAQKIAGTIVRIKSCAFDCLELYSAHLGYLNTRDCGKTGLLPDGTATMSHLDELTEDIAVRFDLGPKARTIVHELLGFIAEQPGGIDGILDEIQNAGLEEKAATWFGSLYPWALSAREVKSLLGAEFIERIVKKTRLTECFVSKVLSYAIPKLIGLLEGDCPVPAAAPARLRFPDPALSPEPPQFETFTFWRKQMPKFGMGNYTSAVLLLAPAAAVLVTLGLFWHSIVAGTAGDHSIFQPAPILAENEPVTFPRTPASGSHLALGGFAVETGWIQNLNAVADGWSGWGVQARFGGDQSHVGGMIPPTWVIGTLPYARMPQFVAASLTGGGTAKMRLASSTPEPARLDFPAIIFEPNSATVPSHGIRLLRRVAERIKQLPAGTVVQVNGYTHGAARPAANAKLSQTRADSVYRILIRDGVSPAMLSANGYGSSAFLASINGVVEGRSSKITGEGGRPREDRRVEFCVIPPRP